MSKVRTAQRDLVLRLLRRGAITQHEVLEHGIQRLASRIHELRRHHRIRTDKVRVRTRYGETKIARYRLIRDSD